jgi:peptidoglycan hydrolase CwlO-like protein
MADLSQEDKIDAIYQMVQELSNEVSGLKSDVSGLKNDVSDLKSDVSGLKNDVNDLKSDVKELKQGQDRINARLDVLAEESHENKADIRMLKKGKIS